MVDLKEFGFSKRTSFIIVDRAGNEGEPFEVGPIRVKDGKLVEVTEFLDTELASSVFG